MSNSYRFAKECAGENDYNYGGIEETIGLIFDNYHVSLDMYRTIVNLEKEIKETKLKAHQDLQKLRDDEERWKRLKSIPEGFDAEEHQNRKNHLIETREAEFDLFYNGININQDPIGRIILNNMKVFDLLEKCDRNTRKIFGKGIKNIVKVAMWPTMKLMRIDIKNTKNTKYQETLITILKKMEGIPEELESYIKKS